MPTAVAAARNVNKFTFADVTLVDGELTVTNAVIEASSKSNNKGTFTQCSYFTEGWGDYLGAFASDDFASADADDVREFCIENFENRS